MKRHIGAGVDRPLIAAFASSLFSVGGLLGALAYFIPPMGLMDEDAMSEDQVRVVQQYLLSSAEREREATESQAAPGPEPGERAGESGHRSPGAEGKTGSLTSTNPRGRIGVAGLANNTDIRLAREKARIEASTFGMIELLGTMNSATQGAVASPWGSANPLGRDPTNAEGQMWGDAIGESAGFGGLSLSGTGEGGGCRGPGCGAGIGIDNVGTIGGGLGTCDPNKGPCGFGRSGGGGTLGSHKTRVPRLRVPNTIVSGRLPPEVIQRVVRQNFGRFRFCYEQGLTRNPNLAGRVGIRFVIGRDGAVSNVADGGSNLPDAAVQSCVLSSFYNLSFPAPEGGIVTVTYPIQFEPG